MTVEEMAEAAPDFFKMVGGHKGSVLAQMQLIRTLAWNPDLATSYFTFGKHVLLRSSLPKRWQSLVTLRSAWLLECEYEWEPHVRNAPNMGVTADEVEAVKVGSTAPSWDDGDRMILRAVEEVHGSGRIGEETWAALSASLEPPALLDLLFTAGNYALVSLVVKTLGLDPD
jgi:alkylhydroperoxidase family enzyme